MNVPTRAWQRPGMLIASAAAGLIGVGLCAAPASAHTPSWSVSCSEVTVSLKAYNSHVENTVAVSVDGKDLLKAKTFGSSFNQTLTLPDHSSAVKVHLVVKAGDSDKYNVDQTKSAPACESSPPPTNPEPSETSTPSKTPTEEPSKPAESPSSSAPVVAPSSAPPSDLAETGASSSTPLIAGAAALVVVAGGGIMLATRKRRTAGN